MPQDDLVITQMYDVTVADFRNTSLLDGTAVDAVANQLFALVDNQARRKILLDFSEVRFLSSTMLGVLMSLNNKSVAIKGRMVICGLEPKLKKVFKITRMDKLLTFAETEDEALKMLNARPRT